MIDGWIDPNGKFHIVGTEEHFIWLKKNSLVVDTEKKQIFTGGWIRVGISGSYSEIGLLLEGYKHYIRNVDLEVISNDILTADYLLIDVFDDKISMLYNNIIKFITYRFSTKPDTIYRW